MAKQLRTWSYGGPKFDDQHPNGCLTAVCNSSFKGPDTLLRYWIYMQIPIHIHTDMCVCMHTHTKICINKLQINWNYVKGQTKHQIMARIPLGLIGFWEIRLSLPFWEYIIKPCLPQKSGAHWHVWLCKGNRSCKHKVWDYNVKNTAGQNTYTFYTTHT